MGFFSWQTSDTDESISNNSSDRGALAVKMLAPDGRVWEEKDYDGYGVFGGKDYYELLAELNGGTNRDDGINIAYDKNPCGDSTPGVIYPKLVSINYITGGYDDVPNSVSCPDQGYFYCDEEEEETCWECGEASDWCCCDDDYEDEEDED